MSTFGKPAKTFVHACALLDGTNEYRFQIETPLLGLDMVVVKRTTAIAKVSLWNYTRGNYLVWNKEITDTNQNINLRWHVLNIGDVLVVRTDAPADVSLTFLPVNVSEQINSYPLQLEVLSVYDDRMLFFHSFKPGQPYTFRVSTDGDDLPDSGAVEIRNIGEGFQYANSIFTGAITTIESRLLQEGDFNFTFTPSTNFAGFAVYGSGPLPFRADGYLRLELTEDSRIRLKQWDA